MSNKKDPDLIRQMLSEKQKESSTLLRRIFGMKEETKNDNDNSNSGKNK